MRFVYIDSSAAIKLFKREVETEALEDWLVDQAPARQITSHLTRTEVVRGLHAVAADDQTLAHAAHWLQRCAHVALPAETFDHAGVLAPGSRLRSLDAVHLAAALSLGDALASIVTYDKRLAAAATAHAVAVVAPS